jgi:hypothetical protein
MGFFLYKKLMSAWWNKNFIIILLLKNLFADFKIIIPKSDLKRKKN